MLFRCVWGEGRGFVVERYSISLLHGNRGGDLQLSLRDPSPSLSFSLILQQFSGVFQRTVPHEADNLAAVIEAAGYALQQRFPGHLFPSVHGASLPFLPFSPCWVHVPNPSRETRDESPVSSFDVPHVFT